MRIKGKRRSGKREANGGAWATQVKGSTAGVVAVVFILFVCAGMIAGGILSERSIDGCALIAAAIGVSVSEIFTAVLKGRGGAVHGIGNAVIMLGLFAVSGLLLYGRINLLRCLVITAVCFFMGGITGLFCRKNK